MVRFEGLLVVETKWVLFFEARCPFHVSRTGTPRFCRGDKSMQPLDKRFVRSATKVESQCLVVSDSF